MVTTLRRERLTLIRRRYLCFHGALYRIQRVGTLLNLKGWPPLKISRRELSRTSETFGAELFTVHRCSARGHLCGM